MFLQLLFIRTYKEKMIKLVFLWFWDAIKVIYERFVLQTEGYDKEFQKVKRIDL